MAIATKGEILCVSLHGDYRYDPLKNTPEELRDQEKELQKALIGELKNTPLIVTGYMLEIQFDQAMRYVASRTESNGKLSEDNYPVRRGTAVQVDTYTALLWVHGAADANNPRMKYFQGKRRIPAPLTVRRHVGHTDLARICEEILGLSKMNWN